MFRRFFGPLSWSLFALADHTLVQSLVASRQTIMQFNERTYPTIYRRHHLASSRVIAVVLARPLLSAMLRILTLKMQSETWSISGGGLSRL